MIDLGGTGALVAQTGIVAPAETLHEPVKLFRQPEMAERLAGMGSKPEEFAEMIRCDIDRFVKAVGISGMKPD